MKSISARERFAAGKALRATTPRSAQARWAATADRRGAVEILAECNRERLSELVPIRHGRMARHPFAFLRGSSALMATDLAGTPSTGVHVQACGDCHLTNFGLFATPERNLIFDINDFDETLAAPWEWDLKRLVTSFVVAGRVNGQSDQRAVEIAIACARSYRTHLRELAWMSPLEIWYSRVDADALIQRATDSKARAKREKFAAKARARLGVHLFPKITHETDGSHHFLEMPPIVERVDDAERAAIEAEEMPKYRDSLPDDRRVVFDRYRLEDFARRVVGIGSVGTRCYVGLFFCDDQNSLLLQVKEARRSVLAPFTQPSPFDNQGQRVVVGQRVMQAASDIFLGWLRSRSGRDYYVRQLRDMKFAVPVEKLEPLEMERYAAVCGWTLARAHAKSGDAALISGYLGNNAQVDEAFGRFALAYADQTEQDHEQLVTAARAGVLPIEWSESN